MDTKETSLRVLMFPWLAHGHISPFPEPAKKLSNRNLKIYLCSTPISLISIQKNLKDHNYSHKIHFIELKLPSLPNLSLTTTLPMASHPIPIPPSLTPSQWHAHDLFHHPQDSEPWLAYIRYLSIMGPTPSVVSSYPQRFFPNNHV